MITGDDFLGRLNTHYGESLQWRFRFPFARIAITSNTFSGLDDDEREQVVADALELSVATVRETCDRLFLRLDLRAPSEPADTMTNVGSSWIKFIAAPDKVLAGEAPPTRVVHFYGFKGGQARSSVLAFIAKTLAVDGWRVLAVDMDAEAPTLDVLLGVRAPDAASTLLGARLGFELTPVRAYTPAAVPSEGHVDLLPFRPWDASYDLDAAALAMEGNVFPPSTGRLIDSVVNISNGYDLILIDHRTGLASTVPPWMERLRGPVVVFARMDAQWHQAKRHVRTLWSLNPTNPGLAISFKSDDEPLFSYIRRVSGQAEELLGELAAAMTLKSAPDSELASEDVSDHWLVWPYDAAFNRSGVPSPEEAGSLIRDAVSGVRRILGLTNAPAREAPARLHPSGSLDRGDLIQTQAFRELSAPNNRYSFILGRKGTGKTRLLRALVDNGLGEALLVPAEDRGATGITAGEATLVQWREDNPIDAERFWWALLTSGLTQGNTNRVTLSKELQSRRDRTAAELVDEARKAVLPHAVHRTFLIDGLETAFPGELTFTYIGALFRVVSTVEADPLFGSRVRIRVFIRNDLAERGFENFEQQSHGRTLQLLWSTQAILNFALSRISMLGWFRRKFPEVVARIHTERPRLLAGAVPERECDELLLKIFPEQLRRLNLNTTTFLRTYFSDDPSGRTSYYPRIYDEFLNVVAGENDSRRDFDGPEIVEGRVSDELINFAHEAATRSFLVQVQSELLNLVSLREDELAALIRALRGKVTPFRLDDIVGGITAATGIDPLKVRQTLERMKVIGIFEDRPRYPGEWRVGRLFKTSLGMLYDRKHK